MASDRSTDRSRRPRLRLVTEADVAGLPPATTNDGRPRPRTIGRLIAQAAMLADSASEREQSRRQGLARRIFGRRD